VERPNNEFGTYHESGVAFCIFVDLCLVQVYRAQIPVQPGVRTMFARIVELVATSDAAAEFVQVLHEKALPKIKAQAGCMGAFVEMPQGGSVVIGLSLWESRRDAERFRVECYPEIEDMLLPFLKSEPRVRTIEVPEIGKIVVHARAMAAKGLPGSLPLH
jgi:hypothetical protein